MTKKKCFSFFCFYEKIITRPVGLEPTALGFGNLRSTN